MRAVVVSEGCCYPANSGARLRTLHLMLPLARRHDITYICRGIGTDAEAREAGAFFAEHGIRAVIVNDLPPSQSKLRFALGLAANLFTSTPYSVQVHNSSAVWRAIDDHARSHEVDLWQIEWLPYVKAVGNLSGRKLYVAHDITAQLWQRHYQTTRNPLKRLLVRGQWKKMQRYEGDILSRVDRIVAVTEEDVRLIRGLYGIEGADVVENGVDVGFYADVRPRLESSQILYVGALESRPNQDAARVMLDEVFPAVRKEIPEATLCLVGRNPPSWMRERVGAMEGVELHANVPDVRPYLAGSAVMAVPLRIGGGSRIKILESLACGLPVVSTRVGAEGLPLKHEEEIVIVDSVSEMAGALVRALGDRAGMARMAQSGKQIVEDHFDWNALAFKLEEAWTRCISDRSRISSEVT